MVGIPFLCDWKEMRKVIIAVAVSAMAAAGMAQVADLSGQAGMDAQIQAVKQSYEDAKAAAQAQLEAKKRTAQEQEYARQAQEKAAKEAADRKLRAQAAANAQAAKEKAERAAIEQQRKDESAQMDLEMKKLQLEKLRSEVERDKAINAAQTQRAADYADADVERARSQAAGAAAQK